MVYRDWAAGPVEYVKILTELAGVPEALAHLAGKHCENQLIGGCKSHIAIPNLVALCQGWALRPTRDGKMAYLKLWFEGEVPLGFS